MVKHFLQAGMAMWTTDELLKTCACGAVVRPGQRNCLDCHAAAMRKHREHNTLEGDAKIRDAVRHYAQTYRRRGHLRQEPCLLCGCVESEMHHPDYSKPLDVLWLCRYHHLAVHAGRVSILSHRVQPALAQPSGISTMSQVLQNWFSRSLKPQTA